MTPWVWGCSESPCCIGSLNIPLNQTSFFLTGALMRYFYCLWEDCCVPRQDRSSTQEIKVSAQGIRTVKHRVRTAVRTDLDLQKGSNQHSWGLPEKSFWAFLPRESYRFNTSTSLSSHPCHLLRTGPVVGASWKWDSASRPTGQPIWGAE